MRGCVPSAARPPLGTGRTCRAPRGSRRDDVTVPVLRPSVTISLPPPRPAPAHSHGTAGVRGYIAIIRCVSHIENFPNVDNETTVSSGMTMDHYECCVASSCCTTQCEELYRNVNETLSKRPYRCRNVIVPLPIVFDGAGMRVGQ